MEVKEKRRRLNNMGMNKGVALCDGIIMYEILPRVNLKSLLRFKVVCKEWNRVISKDAVFRACQYERSRSLPPCLIYYGSENYVFLGASGQNLVGKPDINSIYMCRGGFKYMMRGDFEHLLDSSNGLICGIFMSTLASSCYYVSNPITKEWVFIPLIEDLVNGNISLGFEPFGPYFVLVSRYVIKWDDDIGGDVGFRVYSSDTGMWRVANAKVRIDRNRHQRFSAAEDSRSVWAHGNIMYWRLSSDVLWLSINKDTAGVVALPYDFAIGEIGEWNGELSYTTITRNTNLDIEIWVLLKSESESQDEIFNWEKKHCLSLKKIFEDNRNIIIPNYLNIMELVIPSSSHYQEFPYEGGDVVLFWMCGRTQRPQRLVQQHNDQELVFAYNIKTGGLQLNSNSEIFNSEIEKFHNHFISYRPSLFSVPTPPTDPRPGGFITSQVGQRVTIRRRIKGSDNWFHCTKAGHRARLTRNSIRPKPD